MTELILTSLKDIMNNISSGLLIPTIIILLFFLALSVVELGSLMVEIFKERRRIRVNVPELLDNFQGKDAEQIMAHIQDSPLYKRQKAAIEELLKHNSLPAVSQQALARQLLSKEELHYAKVTNRTDFVIRLGPMLGLMGTLMPLGPGMIALGQGDTKILADSLLIAFDTTVLGLVAAGVAFVISRLRKRWYEDNLNSLETLMESLLEVLANEQGVKKRKAQNV